MYGARNDSHLLSPQHQSRRAQKMPLGWLGTESELGLRNFVNKLRHTVADGVRRSAMLVADFPLGQNKLNALMHTGSSAYSRTP
jgi:hypothetical protein